MTPLCRTFAAIAVLTCVATGALAHSFTLLVVAPRATGSAEADGIWTAVRIATRERDGHPDETSDGHLGGLDVHLTVVPRERLGTSGAAAPDIIAAPFAEPGDTVLGEIGQRLGAALLIGPPSAQVPPLAPASGQPPFETRFRAELGRAPTPAEADAYHAALLIDRSVRAQGGVGDRAALVRAFTP